MLHYYTFRQVSGSALGFGCCSWGFRASTHSFTGFVVAASFLRHSSASAFAQRWASRLGCFCVVRRSGSVFVVSVPAVRVVPSPTVVSGGLSVSSYVTQAVFSRLSQFSHFGFSGSRSVVSSGCSLVASLLRGRFFSGDVGCARGVDSFFASAFPFLAVTSAQSFGSGRSSFAQRSIAVVDSVASRGGLWCSFPASSCPSGLVPSGSSSRCFSGSGSGSWASLCYAVGRGCASLLFLPPGVSLPHLWLIWCYSLGGDWWFFPGGSPLV